MNYRYYNEFEAEGIATPAHKAYIRAVDEANDPRTKSTVFIQREQFLEMFCQNFHTFNQLTEQEETFFQVQIAKRSVTKYTRQVEMLRRENSSEWLSSIKKRIHSIKSEEYRHQCLYKLTEDIDLLFYGFESYGEDPKDEEQEMMDEQILEGLLELCTKPWERDYETQLLEDGFQEQYALSKAKFWLAKLEKLPRVTNNPAHKIRMDVLEEMLAQVGLT